MQMQLLAILGSVLLQVQTSPSPVDAGFRVDAKLPDVAEMLTPAAVHLDGWLGDRVTVNAKNRLVHIDMEPLLAGFRKKPGSHPWIGEHIGKWLHAATLAWVNTGDPVLRQKLDRTVAELVAAQEPDGYLGTYLPEQRFGIYKGADWDVWSHKYNLLGLLTYYRYTGNEPALAACRKMGDLLIRTFPAKKGIIAAGTHVGMAATSVLEPIVLLYRCTGDERYLDFARYLVKSWDEPNGPKIIATLLQERAVNKTANAKAYEMLSNLVGLCELARVTGDRSLLEPVLIAWEDITAKRLYLTGSASYREHFAADYDLPNQSGAHVGETCVTVTWIQLNLQLLRLTGEAKYGDELERAFYNHLAAAQHPKGDDWCYYTALEGRKPYDAHITCCHSSGPRGMVLAPLAAYLRGQVDGNDSLLVSTLETSHVTLTLGGQTVNVEQQSEFPRVGRSVLTMRLAKPATFALQVRVPQWASPLAVQVASQRCQSRGGWALVPAREWKDGDRVLIDFTLQARLVRGEHGNSGRVAAVWGPFVLAYDHDGNPGLPAAKSVGLIESQSLKLKPGKELAFEGQVASRSSGDAKAATLVPFADAGAGGRDYCVWLREPGSQGSRNDSLLMDGEERRSREGNQNGSINDDDPGSIVVTFDGRKAAEDWFAVMLSVPVNVHRVVFYHGRSFHDGGWFDTSAGKPRVQVQRAMRGPWETIGTLDAYPLTTATNPGGIRSGEAFTLRLPQPVTAVALRVVGSPTCGDNPKQAFTSCGELQAFAE
jgi:DUF1680 family protein